MNSWMKNSNLQTTLSSKTQRVLLSSQRSYRLQWLMTILTRLEVSVQLEGKSNDPLEIMLLVKLEDNPRLLEKEFRLKEVQASLEHLLKTVRLDVKLIRKAHLGLNSNYSTKCLKRSDKKSENWLSKSISSLSFSNKPLISWDWNKCKNEFKNSRNKIKFY